MIRLDIITAIPLWKNSTPLGQNMVEVLFLAFTAGLDRKFFSEELSERFADAEDESVMLWKELDKSITESLCCL